MGRAELNVVLTTADVAVDEHIGFRVVVVCHRVCLFVVLVILLRETDRCSGKIKN